MLAPAHHREGYLAGLGRSKYEYHMGRGLFEGLEQGVERTLRKHVGLVDYVDLVLAA